jgi:flagellar biosynthesis/type III secretory pathway protein FliH
MALKERVNKLYDHAAAASSAELDRVIEREIERLGVEAAQKVIDEFLREYKADELRDTTTET